MFSSPGSSGGTASANPTADIAGDSATRCSSRRQKLWRLSCCANHADGNPTFATTTPVASKPGSTRCNRRKLWSNNAAPQSSGSASANSATTKPLCNTLVRRDVPARRESAPKDSARSLSAIEMGAMLTNTPLAIAANSANTTARRLSDALPMRGRSGARIGAPLSTNAASAIPATPAIHVRTRLSVINSRARRDVPAPSAPRTASSCCRCDPRTSINIATLATATRNTSPTPAANSPTCLLAGPSIAWRRGIGVNFVVLSR